jgi:hypothetical protein
MFHAALKQSKHKYWRLIQSDSLTLKISSACTRRFGASNTVADSKERDTNNSNNNSPCPSKIIVSATKKWLDLVVIGEELCPFVLPLKESNAIRFVSSNATTVEQALDEFEAEAKLLLKGFKKVRNSKTKLSEETAGLFVNQSSDLPPESSAHRATLLSFHGTFVTEFNDFDTLCELVNHHVLIENRFYDILSVMNFHPDYVSYYDKRPPKTNDSFYYPKRSPFPTMLLVPNSDMQSALRTDGVAGLRSRNKSKFVEQGMKKCQERLRSCYNVELRGK